MMKRYLAALSLTVVLAGAVYAGRPLGKDDVPPPPSPLERAQVEKDVQRLQLIQTQVQLLNLQFQQTQGELQQKLKALERDGFDLNMDTWTYVRKPKK